MSDLIHARPRRWGKAALIVALSVVLGGVAMLWAWNTLAVDLFQAPAAQFKHALALQAAIAAIVALPLILARRSRRSSAA